MPTIRALGLTVEVDLGEAIPSEDFERAWSRCLVEHGAPDTSVDARAESSLTRLTQTLTRALIDRRRGELLMLHAGAVCHPTTGASIAYVAPGGTGKTTLSRLLGQRYGYLTDETVGVQPGTWLIDPYEKPLSLRTDDGGFPKTERSPDDLGLARAHGQPRLVRMVLIRRDPERRLPQFTKLDLFDAIPMLASESSSLGSLPRPLHLLADLEKAMGGIWLAEYGEAEQLVDWMAESVGA